MTISGGSVGYFFPEGTSPMNTAISATRYRLGESGSVTSVYANNDQLSSRGSKNLSRRFCALKCGTDPKCLSMTSPSTYSGSGPSKLRWKYSSTVTNGLLTMTKVNTLQYCEIMELTAQMGRRFSHDDRPQT